MAPALLRLRLHHQLRLLLHQRRLVFLVPVLLEPECPNSKRPSRHEFFPRPHLRLGKWARQLQPRVDLWEGHQLLDLVGHWESQLLDLRDP